MFRSFGVNGGRRVVAIDCAAEQTVLCDVPVAGAESVRKLLDPTSVPSDLLIERARRGSK